MRDGERIDLALSCCLAIEIELMGIKQLVPGRNFPQPIRHLSIISNALLPELSGYINELQVSFQKQVRKEKE